MKELTQQQVKVWDLFLEINCYLEGKLDDWPDNVQEKIHKLVEAKSREVELPLLIVDSTCIKDYGDTPADDKWVLQVVISEIVAKDIGYEKRILDRTIRMMKETKH